MSLTARRCRPRGGVGSFGVPSLAALGRWWVEGLLTVALVSPVQICIFVGETLLFSNWAITADILMVRQAEVAFAD